LKILIKIRAGGVAQGVGPEFKPQHNNNNNNNNNNSFLQRFQSKM
jgi:hypothetical protein